MADTIRFDPDSPARTARRQAADRRKVRLSKQKERNIQSAMLRNPAGREL